MTGWFTMIDEHFEVPFETTVLGIPVTVERVDLGRSSEQIVAICRHGRERQLLPILDLPLADATARGRRVDRGVPTVARGQIEVRAMSHA